MIKENTNSSNLNFNFEISKILFSKIIIIKINFPHIVNLNNYNTF